MHYSNYQKSILAIKSPVPLTAAQGGYHTNVHSCVVLIETSNAKPFGLRTPYPRPDAINQPTCLKR